MKLGNLYPTSGATPDQQRHSGSSCDL